jgi:hypothetical protein
MGKNGPPYGGDGPIWRNGILVKKDEHYCGVEQGVYNKDTADDNDPERESVYHCL